MELAFAFLLVVALVSLVTTHVNKPVPRFCRHCQEYRIMTGYEWDAHQHNHTTGDDHA